ncbi:MAG: hypothetical protein ACRDC8_17790, partial [Aeromonas veronii]
VCWAKNLRLELNEVKPNVYRETYLQICFTDRPNPCLFRSGWRNNAHLLGFATLCANLQKPRYRP